MTDDFPETPSSSEPAIPLQERAVCLDCQTIFNIRQGICPQCGSQAAWLVVRWQAGLTLRTATRVSEDDAWSW